MKSVPLNKTFHRSHYITYISRTYVSKCVKYGCRAAIQKKRIAGRMEIKTDAHYKELTLKMALNDNPKLVGKLDHVYNEIVLVINKYFSMDEINKTQMRSNGISQRNKLMPVTEKRCK